MSQNRVKFVLLSLLGLPLLLSCSHNTTVITPGSRTVQFGTDVVNSSRSVLNSVADMQVEGSSFGVFGSYYEGDKEIQTTVFNNEKVLYSGGSWSYSDARMWVLGKTYSFRAIYPYNNPESLTPLYKPTFIFGETNSYQITNFAVNPDVENQVDLLISDPITRGPILGMDEVNNGRDVVNFTFNHLLSNVNVILYKATGAEYDMKLLAVRLLGMYNAGSCINGVWSTLGDIDITDGYYKSYSVDEGHLVQRDDAVNGEGIVFGAGLLLIPQSVTDKMSLVVDFQITKEVEGGSGTRVYNKRAVLMLPNTKNWVSNSKITYVAEITSDDNIIFDSPIVTPWIQSQSGGVVIIK